MTRTARGLKKLADAVADVGREPLGPGTQCKTCGHSYVQHFRIDMTTKEIVKAGCGANADCKCRRFIRSLG